MKNKQLIFGPIIVLAFLALAAFMVTSTWADEPCKTSEALAHLANVKKNQQGIAETRSPYKMLVNAAGEGNRIEGVDPEKLIIAYNDFLDFKSWNKSESEALQKLGCRIDWSTLELVPLVPRP